MSGVTKGCHWIQWPCLESQRVVTEYRGHACSNKELSLNTVAMSAVTKGCHWIQRPCLQSQRVVTEYSGHVCSHNGLSIIKQNTVAMLCCLKVKNWQKLKKTRPNPDLTLESALDTKTEQFKQTAQEPKEATWKSFCDELSAETTLTQFRQFYQQMEGNDRTKTTPDIEDTNRARIKTNEEKDQSLLGRFIQQSN